MFIFIKLYSNKGRLKKIQHKEMQERKRKTIYKRGRIEITLKEPPGRADLPVPHYAPGGRNSREMDLSAGH